MADGICQGWDAVPAKTAELQGWFSDKQQCEPMWIRTHQRRALGIGSVPILSVSVPSCLFFLPSFNGNQEGQTRTNKWGIFCYSFLPIFTTFVWELQHVRGTEVEKNRKIADFGSNPFVPCSLSFLCQQLRFGFFFARGFSRKCLHWRGNFWKKFLWDLEEKITSEHRKTQNKALRRGSWTTPSQRPLFSAADYGLSSCCLACLSFVCPCLSLPVCVSPRLSLSLSLSLSGMFWALSEPTLWLCVTRQHLWLQPKDERHPATVVAISLTNCRIHLGLLARKSEKVSKRIPWASRPRGPKCRGTNEINCFQVFLEFLNSVFDSFLFSDFGPKGPNDPCNWSTISWENTHRNSNWECCKLQCSPFSISASEANVALPAPTGWIWLCGFWA